MQSEASMNISKRKTMWLKYLKIEKSVNSWLEKSKKSKVTKKTHEKTIYFY